MIQDTNKLKTAIAVSVAITFFLFIFSTTFSKRDSEKGRNLNRTVAIIKIQTSTKTLYQKFNPDWWILRIWSRYE